MSSEVEELMVEISREEYERLKRMEQNLFPISEPQTLDTGPNGLIQVVATYVSAEVGAPKIHKLATGGYCYESGLAVDRKKAFDVIPPGRDRDDALYWFDTRFDDTKVEQLGIVVKPDMTLQFEDGKPVESITQITQAIAPGPHQEWVIRCFMQQEANKAKAPSEVPEWMVKKVERPKMATTKPKPKKKGRPKSAPASPPPLPADEVAQEVMAE